MAYSLSYLKPYFLFTLDGPASSTVARGSFSVTKRLRSHNSICHECDVVTEGYYRNQRWLQAHSRHLFTRREGCPHVEADPSPPR